MNKKAYGFTIVELLIVIVVVGILAAISTVAHRGMANSANDTAVRNDLANFAKGARLFHAENGFYPRNTTDLASLKLKVTKSSYDQIGYNPYYCTDVGVNSKFGFGAKSKSGNNFYASSVGSGTAGTDVMFGHVACDPIGTPEAVGGVWFGHSGSSSTWSDWAG